MLPAIILHNLPLNLPLHILEKVLTDNRVPWQEFFLLPKENESGAHQRAYVVVKHKNDIKIALRRMNECEISDCILQAEEIDEAGQKWIEEEKERLRQNEQQSPKQQSPKKPSQKQQSQEQQIPEEQNQEEEIPLNDSAVAELDEDADDIDCLPFASLGISETVLNNLNRLGFEKATPIQTLAIPPAMEGCDLIGRAQTGTGKTLAFGIPIVEQLIVHPGKGFRALVLAPTRELAIQIKCAIEDILPDTGLKTMVVYGGDNILDQMLELRDGIDILIATPGRLLDIQSRGRVRIDAAEILVLDEADRMLDMGFMPQISAIFRSFYEHPQTLLFSATIPAELKKITGVNLKDPVYVNAGDPDLTPLDSVSQEVFYVSPEEKEHCLFDLLDHEKGPIIVFVKTKRSTERLAQRLKSRGYSATRIHGDIDQTKRLQAMDAFRQGQYQILVATDVAARGLDIDNIAHVINFDLPMAPEDHLHRIGRTARAGAKGKATTFVTHKERRTLRPFKKVLGQD